MGVNVKSVDNDLVLNFRIDDQGEVLSIKFSENNRILGIQRTHRSVDFLNFQANCPGGLQYSQECKNKSALLLGFVWCSNYEVLFVTNEQLELYQALPEKNILRLNSCLPLNTCWFLWNPETHICITSDPEKKLHMFQLKTPGTITKGPKFLSPTSVGANGDTTSIEQKHCFLTLLYDDLYFCTIRYVKLYNEQNLTRTISFYTLKIEGPIALAHLVILDYQGPVSFSVLDNLFMVHYQSRKVTSVFDIALNGTVHNVIHHTPILRDISIAPFNLFSKIIPSLSANLDAQIPIDLYSANWIIHLCGVVIDNSLGCSWLLCVNNMVFPKIVANHNLVVDFLLHRSSGKSVLLEYCSKLVVDSIEEVTANVDKPVNYKFDGYGLNQRLDQFAFVFKRICEVSYCGTNVTSKLLSDSDRKAPSASAPSCHCSTVKTISKGLYAGSLTFYIISQSEIYSHLFLKNQGVERLEVRKLFRSILIEYIRIFSEHDICVDHCFYEMLVNLTVRMGDYTQLSFYIQSRLLADSKATVIPYLIKMRTWLFLALQLLSLESIYPAAGQLGIDMLKRLNTCNSELFDALLIKGRPLEALRFARLHRSENIIDMENVRNYLDAIQEIEDYMELYCNHHFLKENSMCMESYWNSDECRKYCTEHFSDLFPST
ncbi:unnamed protein product [Schistosoma rodhaini]|uniref:Mic1 domain-containing protein n=1 Tax=Schistosoma rodhaini TaxID=6188 RepID=A0AA85FTS2_9TREM|nr:unnamed protein product [Schistosoma rodhaini]